ncbi:MAG TPA: transposase [Ktedonobacterales bacterium]|jgi:REP element-mobilizing transposase RayT
MSDPVDKESPPKDAVTWRSRGYLPHLERHGATYFVTFRLADALPHRVLEEFRAERAALLAKAQAQGVLSGEEQARLDLLVSQRIQAYLDAGKGACCLRQPGVAEIMAESLRYFAGSRYVLLGWCIMPNHVHVVLEPLPPATLSTILHTWKSFTSNRIGRLLGYKGALWEQEYYDHLIRDEQALWRILTYVSQNPLKANLKDWPWVEILVPQDDLL